MCIQIYLNTHCTKENNNIYRVKIDVGLNE